MWNLHKTTTIFIMCFVSVTEILSLIRFVFFNSTQIFTDVNWTSSWNNRSDNRLICMDKFLRKISHWISKPRLQYIFQDIFVPISKAKPPGHDFRDVNTLWPYNTLYTHIITHCSMKNYRPKMRYEYYYFFEGVVTKTPALSKNIWVHHDDIHQTI
jgi:hypothetical protein